MYTFSIIITSDTQLIGFQNAVKQMNITRNLLGEPIEYDVVNLEGQIYSVEIKSYSCNNIYYLGQYVEAQNYKPAHLK